MGRPLPKNYLGNTSNSGAQIRLVGIVDAGEGLEDLYIVEQLSTSIFKVADPTNTRSGVVTLQGVEPDEVGQAWLLVEPFGGGSEYARKVMKGKVETFNDNRYTFVLGVAASAAGEATVDAV